MQNMVHPTAIVDPGAQIGTGVKIGAFTIVGKHVQIGDNSEIGSFCEIGIDAGILPEAPLEIGSDAIIRSGTIIYQGCRFGPGLRTGHRVTIREGTIAGDGFQVGTLSDIQGHCVIGDHVRFHSNVHIGQHSRVGNFVWIFPYVVLTNDPHPPSSIQEGCVLEDFSVIATMSTVLPGKRVGCGALVGAMTLVRDDVPADTICVGVPGRNVGGTSKIRFKGGGDNVYPWRRHFHRGYPAHVVDAWKIEFDANQ